MIVTENLPAYTRYHWAKSDRTNPRRIHLLDHHLADVGACMEALLHTAHHPPTAGPFPAAWTPWTTQRRRACASLPPCTTSAR